MPRFLLVELPFKSIYLPNIGLSILKKVIEAEDCFCQIQYSNLTFARLIGVERYETIAEKLPVEHLIGDLVFAHRINPLLPDFKASAKIEEHFIPDWLQQMLPELQHMVDSFIEQLLTDIQQSDSDCLGFNLMFNIMPSLAVAKAVKERFPDKIIVFGGANCEASMGKAIYRNYPWVDYICQGEGEFAIRELIQMLKGNLAPNTAIQGVLQRNTQHTNNGFSTAQRVKVLNELPSPDYSDWLEALAQSDLFIGLDKLALPIETSRGCWYGEKHHCTFCGLNGESLAYRSKTSQRVIQELKTYQTYGINNLFAVDLIMPNAFFTDLIPQMIREKLGYNIFYELKSNLKKEQLYLLRQAGIVHIQPGIESLHSEVLKLMNKGVSAYQNIRLIKWSMELGINVVWNLLYGFPNESAEHYSEMVGHIPAMIHLRPPVFGCIKVRLDRFSPLFFDRAAMGVHNVRPYPAYKYVYGLPDEELNDLAYHFEFGEMPYEHPNYVEQLRAAVGMWHQSVGETSFCSLQRGKDLHLFDCRETSEGQNHTISNLEKMVFLDCDAGISLSILERKYPDQVPQLKSIVEKFLAYRWAIMIDDRLLSLDVKMDLWVPENIPADQLSNYCHKIYVLQISQMCAPFLEEYKKAAFIRNE